jgi:hypothetical protein
MLKVNGISLKFKHDFADTEVLDLSPLARRSCC